MALRVVLLTLLMMSPAVALQCIKVDECSCKFDDVEGAVISLRPLLNHTGGPPLFQDYPATDGFIYSYNPCYPFSEGNCTDSAICQHQGPNGTASSLVVQNGVQFGVEDSKVALTYFGQGGLVQAVVTFECVDNMNPPTFTAFGGEGQPKIYQFLVESMCACKNACIQSHPSSSIGAGSVVLIVFFSLVFLYLVLGSLYGKVVKKANGLEVLPNYDFWVGLPSTVKDIAVNISIFQLIVDFLTRLHSVVCHCFLSNRLTYPEGSLYIVRCVCCQPDRKKYDEIQL